MQDKSHVKIGIIAFLLFTSSFTGLVFFTDVYDDIYSNIVSVTCLSCIKLQPKTSIEFTFDTYQDRSHPDFVLENLSEGPVLIAYRTDVCEFCDVMDEILKDIFDVNYTVEDGVVVKIKEFNNLTVTFIHINNDRAEDKYKNSQNVYMKDVFEDSVPMFTMITVGYNRGLIEEYYATAYGTLQENSYNERKNSMFNLINDGIRLYEENKAGYEGISS